MEYAKNGTSGELVGQYNTSISIPELQGAIARVIIPSTGKKQFHVKLNVKPTNACITSTGAVGVTGNSALNSTKRLLNWEWRNASDSTYFCDSVKPNGDPNGNFFVCDGTQFYQEVLNRILAVKNEN